MFINNIRPWIQGFAAVLLISVAAARGDVQSSGEPVKHVTAGAGLQGGGDGPSVALSVAPGGISPSMLSDSTINSLRGPAGPAGPQGIAGPQGPAGPPGSGGTSQGPIIWNTYSLASFQQTTFDTSWTGLGTLFYLDGVNSTYVGPALFGTWTFSSASPVSIEVQPMVFNSDPAIAPYADSTWLFSWITDGGGNVVTSSNPAGAYTFYDYEFNSNSLVLPAGTYTIHSGFLVLQRSDSSNYPDYHYATPTHIERDPAAVRVRVMPVAGP